MQLHESPAVHGGEFPVNMNPGNGSPFGVLHLAEGVSLTLESDEDCDRLICAALRVKNMRAALGTPHAYEPGAGQWGTHCVTCGALEGGHPERGEHPYRDAPVMAAAASDIIPSVAEGSRF